MAKKRQRRSSDAIIIMQLTVLSSDVKFSKTTNHVTSDIKCRKSYIHM